MNGKRLRKDRRAISTILAALLMVVIVVVASVIVYAWSTGLLGGLMGTTPTVKEALSMDSYKWGAGGTLTLYIRNVGTVDVRVKTYYIEYGGATNFTAELSPAVDISVGTVKEINVGGGDFTWKAGGYSYTIKLVTTTGTQFTFNVKTQ